MAVVGLGSRMSPALVVVLLSCLVIVVTVPVASAKRYLVGGSKGWSLGVNYTVWAQGKHFYLGDWLYFVYDRNQMSVLEVNKTNYEKCIPDHPLANFTTGAGRDVVPLNQTRHYYFISSGGFCFGGMKLAIRVEKAAPAPKAAPVASNSLSIDDSRWSHIGLPIVFAIGALWDNLVRVVL